VSDLAIVHVCEALASGILEIVPALANETAAREVSTVVVHGRRAETPVDVARVFDPRVRVVPVLGWGERSAFGSLVSMFRAASVLRRELSRYEGGVLHLHSTYAGVVGRLLPAAGWRCFYTPQGYAFLNVSHSPAVRGLTLATEAFLGRRGHTLACSRTEGDYAARLVGLNRVTVVQNGIDPDSLARDAVNPHERFTIASIGRAAYQRRPDLFAEMTTLLRKEVQAEFLWVGDGPERDVLDRAGVLVSGWLTQTDAAAAMSRVDILLHLSAFEGLPLALLEAMAARRAIVASDLPVIHEVLGDAGILVGGAIEAAAAVRRLHGDESLRMELAARAHERVRRLFTRRAMVERTLAAYELESVSPARAEPGRG